MTTKCGFKESEVLTTGNWRNETTSCGDASELQGDGAVICMMNASENMTVRNRIQYLHSDVYSLVESTKRDEV